MTPFVLMYPAYMGYLNWCYQIVISKMLSALRIMGIIIQRFTAMIQFFSILLRHTDQSPLPFPVQSCCQRYPDIPKYN